MSMKFVFSNEYFTNYNAAGEKFEDKELQKRIIGTAEREAESTRKFGLGNGFRILTDLWGLTEKEIDEAMGWTDLVIIDLFRLSAEGFALALKKMKQYGPKLFGCAFGERDNGCDWDAHRGYFRDRSEAAAWYRKWLLEEAFVGYRRGDGRPEEQGLLKAQTSDLLVGGNLAEHIRQGLPDKRLHFIAQAGSTMLLHHYLEWGFDGVWLERNAGLSNFQFGIAFLRGAAGQYDRIWGLDLSAWEAVCGENLPLHYNAKGERVDGPTEDLLFREWIVAYLSGADFVHQEMTDMAFWLPPREKRKLSPCGGKARQFMKFAMEKCPERGKQYVPVAVMLEHDHGWDAPRWKFPFQVWGNKVPYEHGDFMIGNFFRWAFPGCLEVGREFMKTFQPDLPWESDEEYRRKCREGLDVRPFEKALSYSRWGDSFDVVLENCPARVLNDYRAVIVLGRLTVDRALGRKLLDFAAAGGTVVINTRQIPDGLAGDFGYRVLDHYKWTQQPSTCRICGRTMPEGNFEYTWAAPENSEVIAATGDGKDPLAFSKRCGNGELLVTTPHYNHEIGCVDFMRICRHLLDHLMKRLMIVDIEGAPVEYLVNSREKDMLVTLVNNSPEMWKGKVTVPSGAGGDYTGAEDILLGRSLASIREKDSLGFTVEIPPFGVSVCRVF